MFVSTYSTFVQTHSLDKTQKNREFESSREPFPRYLELDKEHSKNSIAISSTPKKELPLSYISNYKVINNQQKLQNKNEQTKEITRFEQIHTQKSAQSAYSQNSVLFASLRTPKLTLSQTPYIDPKLPAALQQAQEKMLKREMISTYRANQNYYTRAA